MTNLEMPSEVTYQNATAHSNAEYVPALDGLRAIAILMVLVAHFSPEAALKASLPVVGPVLTKLALAGLRGVDLFFVLSGFLITRILLRARKRDVANYYATFYFRRFLRIFPLYYLSLAAVFFVLPHLVTFDTAAHSIATHQWRLWAYLANWPHGPGWDSSSLFALGHFWSLSVEEHFYIVWPFLVYTLTVRRLRVVCITWAVLSCTLGFAGSIRQSLGFDPLLLRWSTLSHSAGLTLGALAAIEALDPGRWSRLSKLSRKVFPALAVLFGAFAFVPRRHYTDIHLAALTAICAPLFLASLVMTVNLSPDRTGGRLLCNPVLRYIGRISYGLYVYHGLLRPALIRAFDALPLGPVFRTPLVTAICYPLFAIAVSMAIATASWYCLEQPILRLKDRFRCVNPARNAVSAG